MTYVLFKKLDCFSTGCIYLCGGQSFLLSFLLKDTGELMTDAAPCDHALAVCALLF